MARRVRWLSVLVAAVAVVAFVGQRLQGRARRTPGGALGSTTRTSRQADVARLGLRVGTTVASNRARWIVTSAERKAALTEELELRTAEDVASTLGNMKGALMKLGQIAS